MAKTCDFRFLLCVVWHFNTLLGFFFLCNLHQGHPHAIGELRSGARKPEGVGPGEDEGHGH